MSILVAITGMNGCGKTVLMQNLATMSALPEFGGFTTGCFNVDMTMPELQYVFSGSSIKKEFALRDMIWDEDPGRMFTKTAKINKLYIAGIDNEPTTTATTYIPPTEVLQEKFFQRLKQNEFFDVIFIEAGDPIRESMSVYAIEQADLCIECVQATSKGAMWMRAHHEYISRLRTNYNLTNGVMLVGIETWHKIRVKETAPFLSLTPFILPFCEEAGISVEQGEPFVIKQKKMALMKNEKEFMDKLFAIYTYISRQSPWKQNISIDEYGQPALLYPQQRIQKPSGKPRPPQKKALAKGRK